MPVSQINQKLNYCDIYSKKEFRTILKRERSRSDRGGSVFSLVAFKVGNGSASQELAANQELASNIVSVVSDRLRVVDEVGWFKDGLIGVVLPGTDKEGAGKFACDIKNRLGSAYELPMLYVCSYPSQRYLENNSGDVIQSLDLSSGEVLASQESLSEECFSIAEEGILSEFIKKMPIWKRILDIVGSFLGLVVLSPIFLLTAIYIKIVSPGPVLFKQKRVGYKGKQFEFFKFRTMKSGNSQILHQQHAKDFINSEKPMAKLDKRGDPRIILGGRILRKSCLDELPQLVNVLRGEMSLVGPRPCIPYEAEEYLRWHARRFDVVPGLSGLWQVSGKSKLTFKQMIRLDIAYAENMSFWFDILIILRTIPAIVIMVLEAVVGKLFNGNQSGSPVTSDHNNRRLA